MNSLKYYDKPRNASETMKTSLTNPENLQRYEPHGKTQKERFMGEGVKLADEDVTHYANNVVVIDRNNIMRGFSKDNVGEKKKRMAVNPLMEGVEMPGNTPREEKEKKEFQKYIEKERNRRIAEKVEAEIKGIEKKYFTNYLAFCKNQY